VSLSIGTKIGTVEVLAVIGRGGMGEVYRARDTKLKRDVAIKTLPDEFSHDADRLNRFQREAEVLASLNHPNIAAIYDLQEADGSRFLVLELVEGETLADRIQRGQIPIEEALPIAKSICDALEAAHEQGIVHRDLKPANIKITPDGKVKVLDFGLAKALESAPVTTLSNSPTLVSAAASNAEVILGTASYMSPEQAKGKDVDRGSDVWAFGCVLYEMLTSHAAFEGETTTEILAGVLKADPDWRRLFAATPDSIRNLLRRCLQKDQRVRLHDIADARIEIEDALSAPEPAAAVSAGIASRSRERFAWILATTCLIAAAVLAVRYFREPAPPALPEMRLDVVTPITTLRASFAISPDGRKLVFVASGDGGSRLWLRPIDSPTAQPMAGTEGATYPFWSPDSRSVGFFSPGKLKRADIGGGLPQTLADARVGAGGAWNPEGVILFNGRGANSPILRVLTTGGEAVPATKLDPPRTTTHAFPQFLPDDRRFLFSAAGSAQGVYLGSLDSTEIKRLTESDFPSFYVPPGWLLFMRQQQLVARRFDLSRGELTGDPITVADQVSLDDSLGAPVGAFSVSASGLAAYRAGIAPRNQLTWFDRTGKILGTVGDPDENTLGFPELSPDGRRVAVDRIVQGNQDIWLIDQLRGGAMRFTFDSANDRRPLWSPDGMEIVFDSNRKRTFDLYIKPSTGAGAEQLLLESPYTKTPDGWSPDGRFLLYNENNGKTSDILALPLQGPRKPIAVANSPFTENNGQFSPDGRWVAYQSNESGRFEIYVVPFPPGAGKWQVSAGGGVSPRWRHDGKEIFFISPDRKMMAVAVSASGNSFEAAPPVALFQTRIAGGLKQQYAVSSDGRFLINVSVADSTIAPITLILNWKPKP
jgi:Tol biopolymer transport system component